jgi:RimJ/RimL family protein N-acetyltransferase
VIQPKYRGHGYGAHALRALEQQARAPGLRKISLHLFGDNRATCNLDVKPDYVETHVVMSKNVEQSK